MKQHKYTVKGTLSGSRCYESYTEYMTPEELVEYMEEISSLFPTDSDGNRYPEDELAQYIHKSGYRDAMLYGVVTEIWVGVKNIDGALYSWTEVTANRELTEIEKEALLDYLTGQFSDGYGEGLEQCAFNSYTETVEEEYWDEEEQETYMYEYDIQVDMYLHLWQPKNFHLEFVNAEDYEVKKVDLKKPEVTKPRCKLIGEEGFEVCGIQQTDTSWTLEEYSKITGWKESNKVRIPYPYNLYFKVIEEVEEVADDYKIGDEIEGYGCRLLAYLEPFNEGYCYPILTDDKDYPVVELVGGRLYPVIPSEVSGK